MPRRPDDLPKSDALLMLTSPLETNHERTLYVPYVFRNHLISRQQCEGLWKRCLRRSAWQPQEAARRACGSGGRERCTDHKRLCRSEIPQQRAILMIDRCDRQYAVTAQPETGA